MGDTHIQGTRQTGWQRPVTAAACGAILCFFSEMMFYVAMPNGAQWLEIPGTWAFYSLAAYASLICAAWAGIRDWLGLFLVGCLFGWIIEGVIVDTVYSALPWTIVFTAMSWHAPVSAMVGLVLVRLSAGWGLSKQIFSFVLLGFGVGVWAQYWPLETNPLPTDGQALIYLVGLGMAVPIANHVLDRLPAAFPFSRLDAWIVGGGLAGLWALKLVLTFNLGLLVLPLVMAPTLWLMRRLGDRSGQVALPARPQNGARHWVFLLVPVLTWGMATLGWKLFQGLQTNIPVALALSAFALGFYSLAIYRALRPRK